MRPRPMLRTLVRWGDDTGSLPLALLVTLVGVSLSAVLAPMVVNQISTTRTGIQRTHALNAAQAGLDVALGHLRAAVDDDSSGARDILPCGPFSGEVGAGGTARYEVTIDYLDSDPQGQDDSWVEANAIACNAGTGPASVPYYALLRSAGTDAASGDFDSVATRSLRATYTFRTTNVHTAGGLIRVYSTSTGTDLCLDAGSADPASGSSLQVQPCSAGSARQSFAYNLNLTLVLVSSKTSAAPLGMCLDAASPHAAGRAVQFRPCASTTSTEQQWIFTDSGNFEGVTSTTGVDGFCFRVQTPGTSGSPVVLGSAAAGTCRGDYDSAQTFVPEAAVGTGPVGTYNGQLANLDQFGRCLDVTDSDVNATYLVASACLPANVTWNQRWSLPEIPSGDTSATGAVSVTTTANVAYCLRSPGSTATGQYVTVAACPTSGATPLDMRWTVYEDTGDYVTGYRIVDTYGYCLAPTDPDATPPDLHPDGHEVSKMVVAECGGSARQKWNAPPYTLRVLPLKDVTEA